MVIQKLDASRCGVVIASLGKDLGVLPGVMTVDAGPFRNERRGMACQEAQPHVIVLRVAQAFIESAHAFPRIPVDADTDATDVVAIKQAECLEFARRQWAPKFV